MAPDLLTLSREKCLIISEIVSTSVLSSRDQPSRDRNTKIAFGK